MSECLAAIFFMIENAVCTCALSLYQEGFFARIKQSQNEGDEYYEEWSSAAQRAQTIDKHNTHKTHTHRERESREGEREKERKRENTPDQRARRRPLRRHEHRFPPPMLQSKNRQQTTPTLNT